ncbi:tetratricopeptide repeat protein [Planococcus shixiaomingii]|uniref:tetratricopeptide repeat protein n=1 Tax=Planococcus shixiaomingii TaxID=3058393 RepID=UPI0026370E6E|nr:hypothetical protein [Planococcus sp. N022]WKA56153.1 hypothetical protein QWY21_07350 [Planococcus sp. N022]
MKNIFKYSLYVTLFIISAFLSVFLIFSQGMENGFKTAVLLIVLCFSVVCISIVGIVIGNLNFLLIHRRLDAVIITALSGILAVFIGAAALGNIVSGDRLDGKEAGISEKLWLLKSEFTQNPVQKNLVEKEVNGITYFYRITDEQLVEQFDSLLLEEQGIFDQYFGKQKNGENPLAIELHENKKAMHPGSLLEGAGGYYNELTETLHIDIEQKFWGDLLLHEYTHYRIDQFLTEHGIASGNTPQWFQEGVSEFMGSGRGELASHYKPMKTVDFHLLDDNGGFHASASGNFDPYKQGWWAVDSLVQNYGEKTISELLLSESIDEFYKKIEALTQQSTADFQGTFLDELINGREDIRKKITQVYKAMKAQKYTEAKTIASQIKATGRRDDKVLGAGMLIDIYLLEGLYDEAITEQKSIIRKGDEWSQINGWLLLGELYLMSEPDKALMYVQKANEAIDSEHSRAEGVAKMAEAYKKINTGRSLEGYKMLLEQDLLSKEAIKEDLAQQLKR